MWYADTTRPTCDECRVLYEENNAVAPCATTCRQPRVLSRTNADAWECFCLLNVQARPVDSFAGALLPLRLADVRQEAARYADADGVASRVILLDKIFVAAWLERKAASSSK